MPCYQHGSAILCVRGRKPPPCSVCRTRPSSKLCDGKPLCSRPLCARCAVSGGHGVDFCPAHASAGEQKALL